MANTKQGLNPASYAKHMRRWGKKKFNKRARVQARMVTTKRVSND